MNKWILALAAALATSVGFAAETTETKETRIVTRIRMANFSPDALPVDVHVDGKVLVKKVPFKTVGHYLELSSGKHQIQLTPAGKKTPVILDAGVELNPNTDYTIAATGLSKSNEVVLFQVIDERETDKTMAKVRFVHLAGGVSAVDVFQAKGGENLFKNLTYKKASNYVAIPAGLYTFDVKETGKDEVLLTVKSLKLAKNKNSTVYIVINPKDKTLIAVNAIDAAEKIKASRTEKTEEQEIRKESKKSKDEESRYHYGQPQIKERKYGR